MKTPLIAQNVYFLKIRGGIAPLAPLATPMTATAQTTVAPLENGAPLIKTRCFAASIEVDAKTKLLSLKTKQCFTLR